MNCKRTRVELWYTKFSIYRALVKKLFKYDKCVYEKNVESSLFREPDKLWQFIRQRRKESSRIISLHNGTDYATSPEGVAGIFRNYFSECYSTDVVHPMLVTLAVTTLLQSHKLT